MFCCNVVLREFVIFCPPTIFFDFAIVVILLEYMCVYVKVFNCLGIGLILPVL